MISPKVSPFFCTPKWTTAAMMSDKKINILFIFQKSGLKPPTSVGKDFNCAPQAL
jgi:hypothetical protein